METSKHNLWRWVRGGLALFLALAFVGVAHSSAGRVVVDHSTSPPTLHVVGQVTGTLIASVIALFALASIYVGMWKRWSFEIVGWVILIAFIFAGMIFS
jgi:hypothetical protein